LYINNLKPKKDEKKDIKVDTMAPMKKSQDKKSA
jgi:hypothetical protein